LIAAVIASTIFLFFITALSSSSFFLFSNPSSEVIIPAPAGALKQQTVKIGALLPLTGVSSSLGESEGVALKIATRDINEYLFKTNSNIGIELVIEDTQTNPSVSLAYRLFGQHVYSAAICRSNLQHEKEQ
jgi:ABC-type branched-subunit amino acid transport system substrate-binding protein